MSATLVAGVAIAKVLLRWFDHSDFADSIDDTTGPVRSFVEQFRGRRNAVAALGPQLASDLETHLNVEFWNAPASDRLAAITDLAELLDSLTLSKELLMESVTRPDAFEQHLLQNGGLTRAASLGPPSGAVLLLLIRAAAERISVLVPRSGVFQRDALIRLLKTTEDVQGRLDDLLARPISGAVAAADAVLYGDVIRSLSPPNLLNRKDELASLSRFATSGPETWQGWEGPFKAGKTALMATFALNPPPYVRVVSFFIIRQDVAARTRAGFLGTVLPQLAALANRSHVPFPTNPRQEITVLTALLQEAAARCQASEPAEQLLLLVDGLDEEAYYSDLSGGTGSIPSLLPVEPPGGVRILVSRRSNPPPPRDLPLSRGGLPHPLAISSTWLSLSVSPSATAAFTDEDVADLMHDQTGVAMSAYLAAADAPLTAPDLLYLLNSEHPYVTTVDVRRRISAAPGRLLLAESSQYNPRSLGYRLGHDLIHRGVVCTLRQDDNPPPEDDDAAGWKTLSDKILEPWVERIVNHGASLAARGWPTETPNYFLSDAFASLWRAKPATGAPWYQEVSTALSDPRRAQLGRDRYGSGRQLARQLKLTESWLLDDETPLSTGGLACLAQMIIARQRIAHLEGSTPVGLPAVYAALGSTRLAIDLAETIPRKEGRDKALAGVATLLTSKGDLEQVRLIAEAVTSDSARAGVAKAMAAAGHVAEALQVVDMIAGTEHRDDALEVVITSLVERGEIDKGRSLAESLLSERARVETFAAMINWLTASGATEQARTLASEFPEGRPREEVFLALVKGLASAEDFAQARAATLEITNVWVREEAMGAVALAMATLAWTEQAQGLIKEFTNDQKRQSVIASVVRGLAGAGQAAAAQALAQEITSGWQRTETLASAAEKLAISGQAEEAIALARAIASTQSQEKALGGVARALATAGEAEQAHALVEELTTVSEREQTRALVARNLAAAGQPEQALAIAEAMVSEGERAEPLAAVARAMVRVGQVDRARYVAARARTCAEAISDGWARREALVDVTVALAAAGQIEQAHDVAGRVGSHYLARDLSYFVRTLAAGGHVEQARDFAEATTGGWQRAEALTEAAHALVTAGQHAHARSLADQAREAAEATTSGDSSRVRALADVVAALAAGGQRQQARRIAHTIIERYPDKATAAVVRALAVAGQTEEALAVAESASGDSLRGDALTALVEGLVADGHNQQALEVAQTFASDWRHAEALAAAAKGFAATGNAERAREIVEMNASGWDRPKAWGAVAEGLAMAGEVEGAFAIANVIAGEQNQAEAFAAITVALAGAGRTTNALAAAERARAAVTSAHASVLNSAADEAEQMLDVQALSGLFNQVAAAFAAAGRVEDARSLSRSGNGGASFDESLAAAANALATAGQALPAQVVAEVLHDSAARSQVLASVARTLAAAGHLESARSIAEKAQTVAEDISNHAERSQALSSVANALAAVGLIDSARANIVSAQVVAEMIPDDAQQARALAAVAGALAATGQHSKAMDNLARAWHIEGSALRGWEVLVKIAPESAEQVASLLVGE